jgi:hypothetical protein
LPTQLFVDLFTLFAATEAGLVRRDEAMPRQCADGLSKKKDVVGVALTNDGPALLTAHDHKAEDSDA